MWSLVRAVTAFFDGLTGLFTGLNPMVGLCVVSVITGGVMLVIFRYTSNQGAIARCKTLIKAYILEVRLFQDDLGLQMAAQRKILTTNMNYMRHALAPMLVMLIPVLIILIQLDVRYAHRPFQPGETTLLKVELSEGIDIESLAFTAPAGITVETPPLRVPLLNEVNWRIRMDDEGVYTLAFDVGDERVTKRILVGDTLTKLAQGRYQDGVLAVWTHPSEPPLPGDGALKSIEIAYPERELALFGFGMHWLLVFFVVSVLFGFAIKGFVGVEV